MATPAKDKEKDKEEKKRNPTMLNRKARHEYALEETYVAGIALTGTEIKSVRLGLANLQDSFCRVQNGEVWVYNLYIAPYEQGNRYNVESRRQRKLLLHKWQITKITTRVNERGLSVIPTKMFFENGFAKLEIGLGRGKKLWDKRDSIADRDRERDQRREVFGRDASKSGADDMRQGDAGLERSTRQGPDVAGIGCDFSVRESLQTTGARS